MSYKSGHIYLVDKEPTNEELANFAKPVQFDVCKDGVFYSILYDKNGNRYIEDRNQIVTGFIKLGNITRVGNKINIGVHPSGFNHWRIKGQDVTSAVAVELTLDPEESLFRIDSIIGNLAGGIFIFPGESNKNPIPVNPLNYPDFAFFKDVLITPESGGSIDPEVLNNYVAKEEESWTDIATGSASNFSINYAGASSRFKINSTVDVPKTLNAIIFDEETDRAVEIWIYNNMNLNINIPAASTSGLSKGFANAPFAIIPKSYAKLKYNPETDLIECWRVNSSGFALPTSGNNGDILEKDSTVTGGVKWSGKLSLYALQSNVDSALANRYQITTTNISAPDATYKWMILTDGSGVTRRLDFATYLTTYVSTLISAQPIRTISANTTLDDTYHNCLIRITANCNITIPNTLRSDFNADFDVIGNVIATFLEGSGVSFSAPWGKILSNNNTGVIYRSGASVFRLQGTFVSA